ncbi:MAG: PEP/pyruvate-binding domain-containing protein, partial [Muribaculaceae bacterium]|nr:PEP/pyruvate-binding domain-containing protein [Muribaculaceae bacterium]
TTGELIMRLSSWKDMQLRIFSIPDDALYRHASTNDFSRWLYSRAMFSIAKVLKDMRFTSQSQVRDVKQLILDLIIKYRRMKNRGVVAIFKRDRFDRYSNFARIGQGSLGGKGRGLAFIDSIIKKNPVSDNFKGVTISIPRTVVLCTDIFDEFMQMNNLYQIALSPAADEVILHHFLQANLPSRLMEDFLSLFEVVDRPLAVRSSSLLEDSHYQPFAGIYSTYMIPRVEDRYQMLDMLCDAIKGVYASVFYSASKAYMNATSNVIDQEKMAVIIQEVVGDYHKDVYFPSFSGVGRSLNYYPLNNEKTEDGIAQVAIGLGKYIVDGGMALRFSPRHPKAILQTSTLDLALRDTQTKMDVLSLKNNANEFFSVDDGHNIRTVNIQDFAGDPALNYMVSTYNAMNDMLIDNNMGRGRRVVTFANILRDNVFPLAPAIEFMLTTGQKEMDRPIEIEFAGQLEPGISSTSTNKGHIYWLQIRPIIDKKDMVEDSMLEAADEDLILRSNTALGHGSIDTIKTIVYVKPDKFDSSVNEKIAGEITEINRHFVEKGENYILIGPGRWGSSDHALGIPVKWSNIANARLIVESSLSNYRVEPSQGTHFFQNLTSFGVGYFTINPFSADGLYDTQYLDNQPAVMETEHVRVVTFDEPLRIGIDGAKSIGVVLKPGVKLRSENEIYETE